MDAVLDDGGPNLGNLGDLMANRLGIIAIKVVAAAGADGRLALDGADQLLGRHQRPSVAFVSLLAAAFFARGDKPRAAFEMRRVSGRGFRGVRRVGVEAILQRDDLGSQGLHLKPQRLDQRPRLGWRGLPNVLR